LRKRELQIKLKIGNRRRRRCFSCFQKSELKPFAAQLWRHWAIV